MRIAYGVLLTFFASFAAAQEDLPVDGSEEGLSKFIGSTPPQQYHPWFSQTDLLPAEAIEAVQKLYSCGFLDPRGCEYRQLTVTTEAHGGNPVETEGWLIPNSGRDGSGRRMIRCAICWNGQIYPVKKIGARADIDAAAEEALQQVRKQPEATYEFESVSVTAPHPVRIALLIRFGDFESAEQLYAAFYEGPEQQQADRFFFETASGWARTSYRRLVSAHGEGDPVLGKAIGQEFARSSHQIIAEAVKRGYDDAKEELAFLTRARGLLNEQLQRDGSGERPPRAILAGRAGYPHEYQYVQALSHDLREIALTAPDDREAFYRQFKDEPTIRELISLGESAVAGLFFEFLKPQPGLTRIIDASGDEPVVLTTADVATFVVREILQGEAATAKGFETFWKGIYDQTSQERWVSLLSEDNAPTKQWEFAAKYLTGTDTRYTGAHGHVLKVEASETDLAPLIAKRLHQSLEAIPEEMVDVMHLMEASGLAVALMEFDVEGHQAPLRELSRRLHQAMDHPPQQRGRLGISFLGERLGMTTSALGRAGDAEALRRYAKWLRAFAWDPYGNEPLFFAPKLLMPLWECQDNADIAEVSDWLFEAEDSPWAARFDREPARSYREETYPGSLAMTLLRKSSADDSSALPPALQIPAFRRRVMQLLRDPRPAGEVWVERRADGTPMVNYKSPSVMGNSPLPKQGTIVEAPQVLRVSDLVAWSLVHRAQLNRDASVVLPEFSMVWTVAERDTAIANIRALLEDEFVPVEEERP